MRKEIKKWINDLSDDQLKDFYRKGQLGNLAQALGLSGRGTLEQLIDRIRRAVSTQ